MLPGVISVPEVGAFSAISRGVKFRLVFCHKGRVLLKAEPGRYVRIACIRMSNVIGRTFTVALQ